MRSSGIHMGQGSPGDMLQPRLVVHDHIAIVFGVLVHLGLEDPIDIAVAPLALGAAHDKHIEVVFFHESGIEFEFGVIRFGHSGGNGCPLATRLSPLSSRISPRRGLNLHAQDLIEVAVGVRVHDQDRSLLLLATGSQRSCRRSWSLPTPPFTGDGDGVRCAHRNMLL